MAEQPDITTPLEQFTPDQLGAYVDDHLVMALRAAAVLYTNLDPRTDRQLAEDYLRDRLVAISDSYPTLPELATTEARRKMDRLRRSLKLKTE